METGFLQYAVELLKKDYAHELSILTVELPKVDKDPGSTILTRPKSW